MYTHQIDSGEGLEHSDLSGTSIAERLKWAHFFKGLAWCHSRHALLLRHRGLTGLAVLFLSLSLHCASWKKSAVWRDVNECEWAPGFVHGQPEQFPETKQWIMDKTWKIFWNHKNWKYESVPWNIFGFCSQWLLDGEGLDMWITKSLEHEVDVFVYKK